MFTQTATSLKSAYTRASSTFQKVTANSTVLRAGAIRNAARRTLMTKTTQPKQLLRQNIFASGNPSRAFAASLPDHIVLEMPNLSPTMEKGNIKAWLKKEGDEVGPGDVLAAIETDKATVDFEMQEEGFVAKLLYPEGAKDVPLGSAVAILVEDKADIAAFANYDGSGAGETAAASEPVAQQASQTSSPAASAVDYPDHIKLEMPNLSPTMEKGNIQKWLKQVGDEVNPGDVLAAIETDKATVDFEMQEEGFVAALCYPEGAKDVELGKVVAILVENKEDIAAFKDYDPEAASAPTSSTQASSTSSQETQQVSTPASSSQTSSAPTSQSGDRRFASPLAKTIAAEKGFNLDQITGTGPHGRILAADVNEFTPQAAAQAQQTSASAPSRQASAPSFDDAGHFEDKDNSQIRKVIAERLTYSKQNIPHYYVTIQVSVDRMIALRAKLNKHSSSKISVNDMVIKAASLAAAKVPETNSSWMGDFVREFKNVNMSVAVQTDHGLMAPVLRNTNLKGLEEIATEIKDIAGRARENKLKPEELSGGTFTLSNLGMFGVNNFSAIINPPQACILAVSAAEQKVVVNEKSTGADDQFRVANVMNVTLSSDHRVVDGAVAATWGQHFKKYIENPELMLL